MQKNAFNLTLATFVAGIFGFFLRWLQNLNGFDDMGLAIPDATISVAVIIYSILVLIAFLLEERFYLRKLNRSADPAQALSLPNFIVKAVLWVAAAFIAVGSLILMFSSDFARYPALQRITGALGIFAGLCLPFLPRRTAPGQEGGSGVITSLLPVAFACLWLVTAYRVEAENPILWSYAPELLAIVALLVSFYYIAAYFFGRAMPARCIFSLQLSSYLCIFTLMDEHSAAETLVFLGCTAAALIFQYMIIHNGEKEPKAENQ